MKSLADDDLQLSAETLVISLGWLGLALGLLGHALYLWWLSYALFLRHVCFMV